LVKLCLSFELLMLKGCGVFAYLRRVFFAAELIQAFAPSSLSPFFAWTSGSGDSRRESASLTPFPGAVAGLCH